MNRYSSQLVALCVAVCITLYFWLKWWAAAACLIVLLLCLICRIIKKKKASISNKHKSQNIAETRNLTTDFQRDRIERRKAQGQAIRTLSFISSQGGKSYERVVNHLLDWHLEYSRKGLINHTDLYDFLIDSAQQRLKSAKADYLKHELRVSIAVVRLFLRGYTPEKVAEWLEEHTQ